MVLPRSGANIGGASWLLTTPGSPCQASFIPTVVCLIFYDLYRSSRATILSFQGGESILAIIALLVLLIVLGLLLFPYLRMRAMFRKSPAMTRARRYTIGTTGITIQSDDATSDCKWSLFQQAVETPSAFVFSLTSYHGIYIPKRCFASSDDVARVRDLIRENMPGSGGSDVHEASTQFPDKSVWSIESPDEGRATPTDSMRMSFQQGQVARPRLKSPGRSPPQAASSSGLREDSQR